jgi:release factor glutamine methyltransferase
MSDPGKPLTVREILRRTVGYFQGKGVSEPRASAEVLLAHTLGLSRLDLYLKHDQPLGPEELSRFRELLKRRAAGEPVAYLTGYKEFWSLPFKVTPAVLIPRPETEVLVQAVLDVFTEKGSQPQITGNQKPKTKNRPWGLEIGVGSGAVVTVLAKELPGMNWIGADLSHPALKVARLNAMRHDAADCITFVQTDLFAGFKPGPWFALIVANLPYVAEPEWQTLSRDIRLYEPKEALVGGMDGLALFTPMAQAAQRYLEPQGWLALEVGPGQAEVILELLKESAAYDHLEVVKDYQRINRVVRARRRGLA